MMWGCFNIFIFHSQIRKFHSQIRILPLIHIYGVKTMIIGVRITKKKNISLCVCVCN